MSKPNNIFKYSSKTILIYVFLFSLIALAYFINRDDLYQKYSEYRANEIYIRALKFEKGTGVEKNPKKAFMLYAQAAALNHYKAQNNLGRMYKQGQVVEQSDEKAFELYSKAAGGGNLNAQLNLGGLYFRGGGVEKNDQKAFEWASKAAEQGLAKAQGTLGQLYAEGVGVKQDKEKALFWLKKAVEQNDEAAQEFLEEHSKKQQIMPIKYNIHSLHNR